MKRFRGMKNSIIAVLITAMLMTGTGIQPAYAAGINPGITEETNEEQKNPAEGEETEIPDEQEQPDGGLEEEKPDGEPEEEQPDGRLEEELPGDDDGKEEIEIEEENIREEEIILEEELDGEIAESLAKEIADNMEEEEDLDYILGRPMTEAEQEEQRRLLSEYVSKLAPLEADKVVESVLDADEPLVRAGALPSSYDSRNAGCITSVKNQGSYGTCGAFSTINSAEASLIKQGWAPVSKVDLSERHLAYYAYHTVADPLGGTEDDSNTLNGSVGTVGALSYSWESIVYVGWSGE